MPTARRRRLAPAADRADLPSVIVRFDPEDRGTVDERVRALPNLAARGYRTEITRVRLEARGRDVDEGVVHIVGGGRRGYTIVEGRDLGGGGGGAGNEAGLAGRWGLGPGGRRDHRR